MGRVFILAASLLGVVSGMWCTHSRQGWARPSEGLYSGFRYKRDTEDDNNKDADTGSNGAGFTSSDSTASYYFDVYCYDDLAVNVPMGSTGLCVGRYGGSCANGWDTWAVYTDDEDSGNSNAASPPLPDGGYGSDTSQVWCCSSGHRTLLPVNLGGFCINKYGGGCPTGFSEGYRYWDDEDSSNANSVVHLEGGAGGPHIDTGSDTREYYCCRGDSLSCPEYSGVVCNYPHGSCHIDGVCVCDAYHYNSNCEPCTITGCVSAVSCSSWANAQCDGCDVGRYLASAAADACPICGSKTYNDVYYTSASSCKACPSHTQTSGSAASNHDHVTDCVCMAGYTATSAGTACSACALHTYKSTVGSGISCTNCPSGSTTAGTATTSLTNCKCPAGKYGSNGAACTVCATGYYKSSWGPSDCTQCPASSEARGADPTSHDAAGDCRCVEGASGTGNACSTCAADAYKTSWGDGTCSSCPSLSTTFGSSDSDHDALTDCACDPGYVSDTVGLNGQPCSVCTSDMYKATRGHSACTPCPSLSVTNPGSSAASWRDELTDCRCPAGRWHTSNGNACSVCGQDQYKTTWGAGPCTSCPTWATTVGTSTSDHDVLTDCKCSAGTTGSDGTACTVCDADKYKETWGSSACTQCPFASETEPSVPHSPSYHDDVADCKCSAEHHGADGTACTACPTGYNKTIVGDYPCIRVTIHSNNVINPLTRAKSGDTVSLALSTSPVTSVASPPVVTLAGRAATLLDDGDDSHWVAQIAVQDADVNAKVALHVTWAGSVLTEVTHGGHDIVIDTVWPQLTTTCDENIRTNHPTIFFTFTFTEPVYFEMGNVSLSGGESGVMQPLTGGPEVFSGQYTSSGDGPLPDGEVHHIDVFDSNVQDYAGNVLTEDELFSLIVDFTLPTCEHLSLYSDNIDPFSVTLAQNLFFELVIDEEVILIPELAVARLPLQPPVLEVAGSAMRNFTATRQLPLIQDDHQMEFNFTVTDLAENVQVCSASTDGTSVFYFIAPNVATADPADAAVEVALDVGKITLRFTKSMDLVPTLGAISLDVTGRGQILEGDCGRPRDGPNLQTCYHFSTCVDDVLDDKEFYCDCAGTGYSGDNCEYLNKTWLDDQTVEILLEGNLRDSSTFVLSINTEAQDYLGFPLLLNIESRFSTVDVTVPSIVSTSPFDGEMGVDVALPSIAFEFQEDITLVNILLEAFPSGSPVPTTTTCNTARMCSVSPDHGLNFTTRYRWTVDVLEDTAGLAISAPLYGGFTTTDIQAPSFIGYDPTNHTVNISVTGPFVAIFDEPMAIGSVGSAFAMYDLDGTQIFGYYESIGDGASVAMIPLADLLDDTEYELELHGGIASDEWGNVAADGGGRVWFVTQDLTKPQILAMTPADGVENVALSSTVTVEFTEGMDVNRTEAAFIMVGSGALEGTFAWSNWVAAGRGGGMSGYRRVTFTPSSPLGSGVSYIVTVRAAATDVAGNTLTTAVSHRWRAEDTTPPRILSVAPAHDAANVGLRQSIRVLFDEDMDVASVEGAFRVEKRAGGGAVGGWFDWSSPAQLSYHTLADYSDDTTFDITISTTATDVSGNALPFAHSSSFATVDLTHPVLLSSTPAHGDVDIPVASVISIVFDEPMDAASVAAAYTLNGSPAPLTTADSITFTDNQPLGDSTEYTVFISTVVADLSGNYLTSPHSITFTTIDVTPPSLVSVVPSNGTTAVNLDTVIRVVLDDDAHTASASALVVKDSTSASVPGVLATSGPTVTFTPSVDLTGEEWYTVEVGVDLTDASANAVTTTGAVSSFRTRDATSPRVIAEAPTPGATLVPVSSALTITFSEDMNSGSTEAAFSLTCNGVLISGSTSWSSADVMEFTPSAELPPYGMCITVITADAKDTSEVPLESSYVSGGFRTIRDAPVIASVLPSAAKEGVPLAIIGSSLFELSCADLSLGAYTASGSATVNADGTQVSGCALPSLVPAGEQLAVSTTLDALPSTGTVFVWSTPHVSGGPSRGARGDAFIITGSGFLGVSCSNVLFGTTAADGNSTIDALGTRVTGCTVPSLPIGSTEVITVDVGGVSSGTGVPFTFRPRLTAVAPSAGEQGVSFSLQGRGLEDLASCSAITFDGTVSSGTLAAVDGQASGCVAPTRSGQLAATVAVNVNGEAHLGDVVFIYKPTLIAIVPAGGVPGTSVTIRGTSFGGSGLECRSFRVKLGGSHWPLVNLTTAPTITTLAGGVIEVSGCASPAGPPTGATLALYISRLAGDDALTWVESSGSDVLYDNAPTLAGVIQDGVRSVTITGTGFSTDVPAVTLAGLACVDMVVAADTEIHCTAPSLPTGSSVTPEVQFSGGAYSAVPMSSFGTYIALPYVFGSSPALGHFNSTLTITGLGLSSVVGPTVVTVGGSPCVIEVEADENVLCRLPDLPVTGAPVPVVVTVAGLDARATFTVVLAPFVESVSPAIGPGGSEFFVSGSGFHSNSSVELGPLLTTGSSADGHILSVIVPAEAEVGSLYAVTVTVGGKRSAGGANFLVSGVPELRRLVPVWYRTQGGSYETPSKEMNVIAQSHSSFVDSPLLTVRLSDGRHELVLQPPNVTFMSRFLCKIDIPPWPLPSTVDVSVSNDNVEFSLVKKFRYFNAPHALAIVVDATQAPPFSSSPVDLGNHFNPDENGRLRMQPMVVVVDTLGYPVAPLLSKVGESIVATVREVDSSAVVGSLNVAQIRASVAEYETLAVEGRIGLAYTITFASAEAPEWGTVQAFLRVPQCPQDSVPTASELTCMGDVGFYRNSSGGISPCPSSYYKNETGDRQCTACPHGKDTNNLLGRVSVRQCVCKEGTYIPPTSLANGPCNHRGCCVPCIDSAICEGGEVIPKGGFWRHPEDPVDKLVQCDNTEACAGGPECAPGYTGPLCSLCEGSLERIGDRCEECPNGVVSALMVLGVLAAVVAITLATVKASMNAIHYHNAISSAVVKMLIDFLQVIGAVGNFRARWPLELKNLLNLADASSNVGRYLFAADCVTKWSFFTTLGVSMSVPMIFGACCLLGGALETLVAHCRKISPNLIKYQVASLVFLLFTYAPLFGSVLEYFHCRDVNGVLYLEIDAAVVCWEGEHAQWLVPTVIFTICYTLGVPLLLCILLYHSRNNLDDNVVATRFGFFYLGFEENLYMWGVVVTFRKVLIILVKVMLLRNPLAQIFCGVLVISLSLLAHVIWEPYARDVLDHLEFVSLGVTFLVMMAGMVFYSNDLIDDSGEGSASAAYLLVTMFVLMVILAVFVSFLLMFTLLLLGELDMLPGTFKTAKWQFLYTTSRDVQENLRESERDKKSLFEESVAPSDSTCADDDDLISDVLVRSGTRVQDEFSPLRSLASVNATPVGHQDVAFPTCTEDEMMNSIEPIG